MRGSDLGLMPVDDHAGSMKIQPRLSHERKLSQSNPSIFASSMGRGFFYSANGVIRQEYLLDIVKTHLQENHKNLPPPASAGLRKVWFTQIHDLSAA